MSVYMQLRSGEPFYVLDAQPEHIDIEDIAHALGMVCRFAGHCQRFYSVAEHSVLMSMAVDPEHALWGLLHDATEAYIGDLVRPLKHELPSYMAVEDRLAEIIAIKFGLEGPMPAQVVEYDTRIVVDEREQIMAPSRLPWPMLEGRSPLGVTIEGWDPITAREMFLSRFYQLTDT